MKIKFLLTAFFALIFIASFSQNKKNLVVDRVYDKTLSREELNDFKNLTRQKVNELQNHIKVIGSKAEADENRDLAIEAALKLFIDDAIMQVSSARSKSIRTYPMSNYFYRLKALKYDRVEITYYDIAYIGDFIHGADGKYYATATIYQKFKGWSGDNIVYEDETVKKINIVLEYTENQFYREKQWLVRLGDIEVLETS